jgi:hypothetical protein
MASKLLSAADLVFRSLQNLRKAWQGVKFTKDLPLFPPIGKPKASYNVPYRDPIPMLTIISSRDTFHLL